MLVVVVVEVLVVVEEVVVAIVVVVVVLQCSISRSIAIFIIITLSFFHTLTARFWKRFQN